GGALPLDARRLRRPAAGRSLGAGADRGRAAPAPRLAAGQPASFHRSRRSAL
ncbi:MAG: hypothetical protein AVDCRST_MAG49-2737, partial [uncultured Thermomicrobiales bacterium]